MRVTLWGDSLAGQRLEASPGKPSCEGGDAAAGRPRGDAVPASASALANVDVRLTELPLAPEPASLEAFPRGTDTLPWRGMARPSVFVQH